MSRILIINGPNLAMLGVREPAVYGNTSAHELESLLKVWGREAGCEVCYFQFDLEGDIVAAVNGASGSYLGLAINPGGLSHTSVAVLDAMRAFKGPVVEIHISQIHRREPYRHRMLTAGGAEAIISGAGIYGYCLAIKTLKELTRR